MRNTMQEDVSRMLAMMFDEDAASRKRDTPLPETEQPHPRYEYDVYVQPEQNRITFIKKGGAGEEAPNEPQGTVVPATPASPDKRWGKPLLDQRTSNQLASATVLVSLVLILFSLMIQLALVLHPPTALIIIIIPKAQQLALTGTLQLGRVVPPITLRQSQTVPATGHGHQQATQATGFLTFYNGLLSRQTIAAGTILMGRDGVQIITDQAAIIPPANPPSEGQATVPAHALNPGASGNIAAYDIHTACCLLSVVARNTQAFRGGQDERAFRTVTQADIDRPAASLKTAVVQGMQGAFQEQLQSSEALQMLPCSPTTTADHVAGEEAEAVTVTVSLTCRGIAYNQEVLQAQGTHLLQTQASQKLGAGYSLQGDVHVRVTRATVTAPRVFCSFSSSGTFVYALNPQSEQQIKALVRGSSVHTALQLLARLPGIAHASIAGIEENEQVPEDVTHIHLVIISEE